MKWILALGVVCLGILSCQSTPNKANSSSAGVFQTDPKAVLARAAKDDKYILMSFNAIWCPPCNQLEEQVYESAGFYDRLSRFELLKVDADTKASWELKNRYKIGGYPTVLFTNSKGEEIHRIVGFREPKSFYKIMDSVVQSKGKNLKASCGSSEVEDLWRCATVCQIRDDHDCASAAFRKLEGKLKKGGLRYQQAEAYFVKTAANDELKRLGYERLIQKYPSSPLALVWTMEYFGTLSSDKKPKQALVRQVLEKQNATDSEYAESGFTESDRVQFRAIILDKLGESKKARGAWKEAAQLLAELAKKHPGGSAARAFALERIYCLKASGDFAGALALAENFQSKYTDEFTFHYAAANVLNTQKRYVDALRVAEKAYELSYGDNRIRVGRLLVELYGTQSDKKNAKRVFTEITKEYQPNTEVEVRTHRYLKQLEKAWSRVDSAKS